LLTSACGSETVNTRSLPIPIALSDLIPVNVSVERQEAIASRYVADLNGSLFGLDSWQLFQSGERMFR
jgi:hypothetical protein